MYKKKEKIAKIGHNVAWNTPFYTKHLLTMTDKWPGTLLLTQNTS
jgi:hypothetical protein